MLRDTGRLNIFDRWAEAVSRFAGQPEFFVGSVILVLVWMISYPLIDNFDTWQIVLSAVTSAITFLLVALLQNAQRRAERAMQAKLDALADGLARIVEELNQAQTLGREVEKLRAAVGVEQRVSGRDVLSGESDTRRIVD